MKHPAVVCDQQQGAWVRREHRLELLDGGQIEMVGRLVQDQHASPQDHGKLVIKILEIRPRGPVHRGTCLVAVPADFTAITPGDTVEPPGRQHRQRVTFRAS
jgi:hypothetical protein